MDYYELSFTYTAFVPKEIINDVLASVLGEINFESFTENEEGLVAYIQEKLYDKQVLETQLSDFPIEEVSFCYEEKLIPGQDWNEEWEKNYFKPIIIGTACMIRASFHQPVATTDFDIVIDPKMAFGTGNHETTFLMISEMLTLDLAGKELLDMGCGTAVLAILAAMKGAARVVAIDIDEWAYRNALDNISLNNTPLIDVKLGGAEQIASSGTFDVVFANINRNILLNDIKQYAVAMKKGALLYMSGFYMEDISFIKEESERHGLIFCSFTEKNNWVAVSFVKE